MKNRPKYYIHNVNKGKKSIVTYGSRSERLKERENNQVNSEYYKIKSFIQYIARKHRETNKLEYYNSLVNVPAFKVLIFEDKYHIVDKNNSILNFIIPIYLSRKGSKIRFPRNKKFFVASDLYSFICKYSLVCLYMSYQESLKKVVDINCYDFNYVFSEFIKYSPILPKKKYSMKEALLSLTLLNRRKLVEILKKEFI